MAPTTTKKAAAPAHPKFDVMIKVNGPDWLAAAAGGPAGGRGGPRWTGPGAAGRLDVSWALRGVGWPGADN